MVLITMSLDCFSPETLFRQQPNMARCLVDCPFFFASGALRELRRVSGIRAPLCRPGPGSEGVPTAAGVGPIGTGSGVVLLRPEFASGFGSRPAAWRFGPVSGARESRRNIAAANALS